MLAHAFLQTVNGPSYIFAIVFCSSLMLDFASQVALTEDYSLLLVLMMKVFQNFVIHHSWFNSLLENSCVPLPLVAHTAMDSRFVQLNSTNEFLSDTVMGKIR
jgi:hypothetical protein